ncbi:Fascin-like protein [Pandoravirus salinus]|uniref:Fascin-like protein n=1 Tax=Pandoravirus salinus TaxID=1349410 RepID=S4VTH3_9VIRU|nr:Fascin-like protein [Pandoravirus salinus]AGO83608.1 Fascin-like protein [Pandoravirus salinus]
MVPKAVTCDKRCTGLLQALAMLQLCAVAACLLVAAPADAYRYSMFVDASLTWTPPVNATNITVTLWGGGGGASTTPYCGASGGSGAAIINRNVGDACWHVASHDVQFEVVVGQGGAGWASDYFGGVAGDGQPTTISGRLANGTELFYAAAYGGGGAKSADTTRGCQGGGGGGEASSAVGPTPGTGNPSGGVDNNHMGLPTEGALVDDVKAGGAGAGYGYTDDDAETPYTKGADWTSPGRHWSGAQGSTSWGCSAWGGAAGFNGNGGPGHDEGAGLFPAPNSGAGGGSALTCTWVQKTGTDDAGASGGAIIEYDLPYGPSPSPTPTPSPTPSITPSRSPTPSMTPSPTSIPAYSSFGLVWPPTGKYLSCASGGQITADATVYGAGEVWTAFRLTAETYAIACPLHGYLTAREDGTFVVEEVYQTFTSMCVINRMADGKWVIMAYYGQYIHANAAGDVFGGNEPVGWTKV